MAKKHQEHILAVEADFVYNQKGLTNSMNHVTLDYLLQGAEARTVFKQRANLEINESWLQYLPYLVISRDTSDGLEDPEVLVYRRQKGIGEERLLGAYSIGWGGHIDLLDIIQHSGELDLAATIEHSQYRELVEELEIILPNGEVFTEEYYHGCLQRACDAKIHTNQVVLNIGCITDTSNAVGRVHLGLARLLVLPHGTEVRGREEFLPLQGWQRVSALEDNQELENWTRILVEYLSPNATVFKAAAASVYAKRLLDRQSGPDALELATANLYRELVDPSPAYNHVRELFAFGRGLLAPNDAFVIAMKAFKGLDHVATEFQPAS